MGLIGTNKRRLTRSSAGAPCNIAKLATSPMSPCSMCALRTKSLGTPDASAIASRRTPSTTPIRISQHHSSKKFRLDWGGLGENGLEEAHLPVSRLGPGCFGDSLKRIVDVAYRQRMLGEPLLSEILARVRHCSVADFQDTRVRLGKCLSRKKQCSQRNLLAPNRL